MGDLSTLLTEETRARLGGVLDGLQRRTAVLPERAMRRSALLGAFEGLSDADVVGTLVLLVHRVGDGQAGARLLMQELALEPRVFDLLPYTRVASVYALAQEVGAEGVARMFLSSARAGSLRVDEAIENEFLSAPLGVRRGAATTRDRFLLDRLMRDRNPLVIVKLLDNPRLTERGVVQIAAMRPTRADVLRAVAAHGRWSSSYRVRKALACNPYTPRPVAMRLLPGLLLQDLRAALEAIDLDPAVEGEVRRLLKLRAARAPAEPTEGDRLADEALVAEALAALSQSEIPAEGPPVQAEDLDGARLYADEDDASEAETSAAVEDLIDAWMEREAQQTRPRRRQG